MDDIGDKSIFKRIKITILEIFRIVIIALVISTLIRNYIFQTTLISGTSMYPTLFEDDRLFSIRIPLYFRDPKAGEIIVFSAPDNQDKDYIKRVIGVEGDKIEIKEGEVYRNDIKLEELYIEENIDTRTYENNLWVVEKNRLFVLGDNRRDRASKDSRYFGTIDKSSVIGIANIRYYPFDSRVGNINQKRK